MRENNIKVEKAMIMAAGVGSRLGNLTKKVPKPLVPIANIPTMDFLIDLLISNGITKIIANTHYLGTQIETRYKERQDIEFESIHEDILSGTAGGVKKCQHFFNKGETFLVLSADGLTDVDLESVFNAHIKSGCIATIVTKDVEKEEVNKFGVIVTNKDNIITEFQEKPSIEEAKSNSINTGIYVFNYDIFNYIPECDKCDFANNVFPTLMRNDIKINTYKTQNYWSDIGSVSQYILSTQDIIEKKLHKDKINVTFCDEYSCVFGTESEVDPTAELSGKNVIGNNCKIKKNAKVVNSIIWDNVTIEEGVTIKDSIITSGCTVSKNTENEIIEQEE